MFVAEAVFFFPNCLNRALKMELKVLFGCLKCILFHRQRMKYEIWDHDTEMIQTEIEIQTR